MHGICRPTPALLALIMTVPLRIVRIRVIALGLASFALACSGTESVALGERIHSSATSSTSGPSPTQLSSFGPSSSQLKKQSMGVQPGTRIAASNPAPLTVDMAAPYFDKGLAAKAAERFALSDLKTARAHFAAYLQQNGKKLARATQARVRLMLAVIDSRERKWAASAKGFERASVEIPLIADYCHYHAARGFFFAHDNEAAMKHARAVSADSIVGADASLLIGDLLRGAGKYDAMAAHYAKYMTERPSGIRMHEVKYRLAQAYEQIGRPKADIISLYRDVTIHWPLSKWASRAQKRLDTILPTINARARRKYKTLTADERIARGKKYFRAMRNPLSEAEFKTALSTPGITSDARCVAAYHRAQSVFKARDRKRAAPLFDKAITACKQAKNVDLHVKAAYQAGRSYAMSKQRETALDRYRQAETVSTEHTYVDDARLRQAEEYADLGQDEKVKATLASIPDRYPTGDMRAEAMWRLGWRAYSEGDYRQAIRWLKKQIEVMPIDDHYYAEGQAQYWLGRAYGKLGQRRESIAAYKQAVSRYPLSYYALLALNRLRESHRSEFNRVVERIKQAPTDYDPKKPAFQFAPRTEYGTPGFARALEFLRLGLGQPAASELGRLGMNAPAGKKRLHDKDRIEKVWATAFLYDRAGRYSQSHWPTRWHILDYKRSWPVGHEFARWRIAYPRGYWDLIEKHANKNGFHTELLMGIMREESAFNPLLESYANAIGLTQMIFPTARRFAKGTGIDVNRKNLRDPEKNVTIGSRFLGFLWKKWNRHIMLIPPSYNAGEGAVSRWLRARGHMAADEWLESIKGDQARRYSKRVISSYFVYKYLESGTIPTISNVIPKRLIPKKKKAKKKKAKRKSRKRGRSKRNK